MIFLPFFNLSKCMLLEDNNTRELRAMMEANIIGLCICVRDTVKMMKDRGYDGHIVNINRYNYIFVYSL